MVGLIIAILLFNYLAFKTNSKLSKNAIIHIWTFTIALQTNFDVLIEFKYIGYWYFGKEVDFTGLLAHLFIVAPVNMMLVNTYPAKRSLKNIVIYYVGWEILTIFYELLTLIPEPWGYFHYGWWNLWYSIIINPILFAVLIAYYKWIHRAERKACLK